MMPPRMSGVINYKINSVEELYSSYMSFVSNGGLFIPSNREVKLGEDIFVVISLPNSPERFPINGKIIWITPRVHGHRQTGFGIQFSSEEGRKLNDMIVNQLAGILTDKVTQTL